MIGYKLINARAETVHSKPGFRSAFKQRRCLVLAAGYFEWKPINSKTKQPFYLQRADGVAFVLAGLWEHWYESVEIPRRLIPVHPSRRDANTLAATVHNRIPVILGERDMALGWHPMRIPRDFRNCLCPWPTTG